MDYVVESDSTRLGRLISWDKVGGWISCFGGVVSICDDRRVEGGYIHIGSKFDGLGGSMMSET